MVPNGWVVKNLDSIYRVIDSLHQTPSFSKDGEYRMVRVTDIKGKNLDLSNAVRVSKEVFLEYTKKYKPKRNDILFSRVGSYGISSFVDTDQEFCLGQNTVIAESNDQANPIYIFNILKSEGIRRQVEKTVDGSSHKTVSLKVIKYLKIPLAPRKEQNKIAQILSTWDQAISTTEKLLEKSQQQKKALVQQLLTDKKRLLDENGIKFTEKWNQAKLSDFFERVTLKNNGKSTNVVTISAQNGLVRQEDFFKKTVASDILDDYFLLQKGQFAYNKSYSNGYPMGAIKRLNKYDNGVVTTLYICFEISNQNDSHSDFWEHYFESGLLNKGLSQIAHEGGRAHGLLNVKPSDFFSLNVLVPSYVEQQKIASVLSSADQEIKTLQEKLACLKKEKKALMQQLLTGKKRVKVAA